MEKVRSKGGTTIVFGRLGDGPVLQGQEHVAAPGVLVPVLAELIAD